MLLMWALVACAPLGKNWDAREPVPILDAARKSPVPEWQGELKVLAWNVKYGAARVPFWFDGFGDRVIMDERVVVNNLEGLKALIEEFDPDIVLAEEIERGSKRSAYVDMVRWLLDDRDLGFNHAAYAPNWQVGYVPDSGVGRVDMGNALFSRYPITEAFRVDQGPLEEQDALTKFFYLDRSLLEAKLDLPSGPLTVFVAHPDAYSTDGTKLRQVEQLYDLGAEVKGDVLVGGDLNVLPPGSLRLSDFADESDVSGNRGVGTVTYEGEEEVLVPFYDLWEACDEEDHGDGRLTLASYMAATGEVDQEPWMSHSLSEDFFWTQRLDYLFSNRSWREGWVVQTPDDGPADRSIPDPLILSDHAPVWGVLELP
ncbi:MAG: endonuclease/exonuclease/phosphatase family metal-dependent hydrolase [Myxococcota bacterium]|jgi:endonuclease/exonuclease/phosphatase family metal-dependent hydrolase